MARTVLEDPASQTAVIIAAVRCTQCGGRPQRCVSFNGNLLQPLNLCALYCWPRLRNRLDELLYPASLKREES